MNKDSNNNTEIRIYQSPWKDMPWIVVCIAFALCGLLIVNDARVSLTTKIWGGWLNIIFFGCGSLAVFSINLYNSIRSIPFLIIDEEKLRIYVQLKRTYQIVKFADVKRFRLIKINSVKLITIDYKEAHVRHKLKETTGVRQCLMIFNLKISGAVESFPCGSLTMKANTICDLLNKRLKAVR